MNIDEYRLLKAELAKESEQGAGVNAQAQQVSAESVQPSLQESQQGESAPNAQGTETITGNETNPSEAQFIDIDGEKVSLDELRRGYLRQSDYTKKTQDVARQQRELEFARQVVQKVQSNPEVQQAIQYNPVEMERQLLEAERYDLMLQREVGELSNKYSDFEVSEVLDFALQRKMNNLEDAYLLNKQYKGSTPQNNLQPNSPSIDVESLKAQIRAELQAELNTSTIISGNSGQAPAPRRDVALSPEQAKVARAMRMSPEEYARWSN